MITIPNLRRNKQTKRTLTPTMVDGLTKTSFDLNLSSMQKCDYKYLLKNLHIENAVEAVA